MKKVTEFKMPSGAIVRLSTHRTPSWMHINVIDGKEYFNRYLDQFEAAFINSALAEMERINR